MQQEYVQGFVDKCAEFGVDPEVVVKQAGRGDWAQQLLNKLWRTTLPKQMVGDFGKLDRGMRFAVPPRGGAEVPQLANSASRLHNLLKYLEEYKGFSWEPADVLKQTAGR